MEEKPQKVKAEKVYGPKEPRKHAWKGDSFLPTYMKVLWMVGAALFIAAGVCFIALPQESYNVLSYVLGAMVLLVGLYQIYAYIRYGYAFFGGSTLLAEGVITSFFGVFLLCNNVIVEALLPIIGGLWLMGLGFTRLMYAFEMARFGVSRWGYELVGAILDIVLGFLFCFDPISSGMGITVAIGVLFIISGVSMVSDGIYFWKMKRYIKSFNPLNK